MPFDDHTFDATLLLGPLYHLASRADRLRALAEARRVTRPGGVVVAAGVSRFVALGTLMLGTPIPDPLPPAWLDLLAVGAAPADGRFPGGHFHTAEELAHELESAGLAVLEVVGVEGPAGLLLESMAGADVATREAAALLAQAASDVPGIRDFSAHLLGIARVPNAERGSDLEPLEESTASSGTGTEQAADKLASPGVIAKRRRGGLVDLAGILGPGEWNTD